MELVLVMVLVAVVVAVVAAPLRPGRAASAEVAESAERAALEAARDAKYREIRDTELDYRTGKLSQAEWRSQDQALKREAMDVLRRLDALDGREGATTTASADPVPAGPDSGAGSLR